MANTLVKPSYILTFFFALLVATLMDGVKPVTANEAELRAFVDAVENGDQKPLSSDELVDRLLVLEERLRAQQQGQLVRRPIFSRRGGPVDAERDHTFDAAGRSCSECNSVCREVYKMDWGACEGWWPVRECICHQKCQWVNNV